MKPPQVAGRLQPRSFRGNRLPALAMLFVLGIFAPSFVLLAMLWHSLSERHALEVDKRGLQQAEAIQSLRRGIEVEIELRRAQPGELPSPLTTIQEPLRLREDGTLLPFEREGLQTEQEEDALLLSLPAYFDAVREEQRGAFSVAVLHYSRALAAEGANPGVAMHIRLAMARALHRAGRNKEALAALDALAALGLSKWGAWECARLRLEIVEGDGRSSLVEATRRTARMQLDALRPELGLLESLALEQALGKALGPPEAAGEVTPVLHLYRFLAAHRDRWLADPDEGLIWEAAPGGAAVLLLTAPDEVDPLERSIRIVPRREILRAAFERDASFARLFRVGEDTTPGSAAPTLEVHLESLHLTLALIDREPFPDSFWGDGQARFLFGLAALTLCGLALGLWASLRAVAKESRLARMRADFISSVSHELKTPLTSLRLYSDLLLSPGRDASKSGEYQERIREETRKLTLMVANVLDASRIEAGREYRMEPVDLSALGGESVQTFAARAEAKGTSIEEPSAGPSAGPGGEPCLVMGDREALEQVLANLLDNAIKYGGPRIQVELDRCADRVKLRVKDDGPGIQKAQRARLFAAYERGTQHGPGAAPGSGLGLAIVRDIMAAHVGASIEIEDLETGGMSMCLSFPALCVENKMMSGEGEEAQA